MKHFRSADFPPAEETWGGGFQPGEVMKLPGRSKHGGWPWASGLRAPSRASMETWPNPRGPRRGPKSSQAPPAACKHCGIVECVCVYIHIYTPWTLPSRLGVPPPFIGPGGVMRQGSKQAQFGHKIPPRKPRASPPSARPPLLWWVFSALPPPFPGANLLLLHWGAPWKPCGRSHRDEISCKVGVLSFCSPMGSLVISPSASPPPRV